MPDWKFRPRKYPHFDRVISDRDEALKMVKLLQATGTHSFLPFMEEPSSHRRFSVYLKKKKAKENGQEVPDDSINKDRPIKYAAHVDAQIFSYYRYMMSEKYEELLQKDGLAKYPVAYRKIPTSIGGTSGKCNIHFAKEAFDEISARGHCVAMTFDIKSFFDCLDHDFLRKQWCRVMGFGELPADHDAVFGAMTDYSYVDKDDCYQALGFFEWRGPKKKLLMCPHRLFREKKKLCSMADYRNKIVGAGLVRKNAYKGSSIPQGIPQGSPMSDVLANIYMIDFDRTIGEAASSHGAYYRRYSDDILLICSADQREYFEQLLVSAISEQGKSTLRIHPDKTTCTVFSQDINGLTSSGDPFNYLGFTFDGQKALYRDRTIAGYKRSVTYSIQAFVKRASERQKATDEPLNKLLNLAQIFHKVGFPSKFSNKRRISAGKRAETNFMSYHLRATGIFNSDEASSYLLSDEQLAGYKRFIKKKILESARRVEPVFSLP